MNRPHRPPTPLQLPAAILCATLFAAPVAHGDDTYVGKDDEGQTLSITNGDSLNSDNAFVGYWNYLDEEDIFYGTRYASSDNHAYVTGTGLDDTLTNWTISGDLYVGDVANYNSVEISNGGSVSSGTSYIGRGIYLSYDQEPCYPVDHNSVTLTGLGATDTTTTWTNTGIIYVGYEWANNNSLTVKSGADVASNGGTIGLGYYYEDADNQGANARILNSDNNTATVTGKGSTWDCGTGDLVIGNYGNNNSLTVSAGGHVSDVNGYISTTSDSTGNIVAVSGSGSTWYNTGALAVGNGGTGSLLIDNGALVKASSITFGTTSGTITLTSDVTALLATDTSLATVTANKIYLGSGSYLAISTDVTSSISTYLSGIMVYDSSTSTWVSASGAGIVTYDYIETDAEGSTLTSGVYTDLGEYTVIYYGVTVPEPATCALFGGVGALGLAMYRRRVQQA